MLSDAGRMYARVQAYYGRDVAEFLDHLDDDVLSFNVRAAFLTILHESESEPDEAAEHAAGMERARMANDRVRAMGLTHG